ncbi:hypothetical protein J6590_063984 [Homalodisca vitripennis]|nr:hypothetical protein J6590_063984 [Homalodisca vitripennis]
MYGQLKQPKAVDQKHVRGMKRIPRMGRLYLSYLLKDSDFCVGYFHIVFLSHCARRGYSRRYGPQRDNKPRDQERRGAERLAVFLQGSDYRSSPVSSLSLQEKTGRGFINTAAQSTVQ